LIIKEEQGNLEKLISRISLSICALLLSLNIFSQNLSFDKGEVYTLDEISVTGLRSFNEQTVITYTGLSKENRYGFPEKKSVRLLINYGN
jgi:hypothetical protein